MRDLILQLSKSSIYSTKPFFRIASDWCDTGAKIKKDEDGFIISLKGFPIPRQH
ncbi:hypothetical protein PRA75_11670 [Klebsiella pneumoniae]|uniref:hypothetical protein n=1 Tax=Klebsiella pneumoniae TaxID=573 RepID=UPI002E80B8EC|nr:hypothetical protein [Klebsiella pneumoniae]MEE2499279.1 hypothetical protein [Klebsiella pneumoniae]